MSYIEDVQVIQRRIDAVNKQIAEALKKPDVKAIKELNAQKQTLEIMLNQAISMEVARRGNNG